MDNDLKHLAQDNAQHEAFLRKHAAAAAAVAELNRAPRSSTWDSGDVNALSDRDWRADAFGYALVGLTLVMVGWRFGRRLGLVGAGLAVVIQGIALALLDLVLASQISR